MRPPRSPSREWPPAARPPARPLRLLSLDDAACMHARTPTLSRPCSSAPCVFSPPFCTRPCTVRNSRRATGVPAAHHRGLPGQRPGCRWGRGWGGAAGGEGGGGGGGGGGNSGGARERCGPLPHTREDTAVIAPRTAGAGFTHSRFDRRLTTTGLRRGPTSPDLIPPKPSYDSAPHNMYDSWLLASSRRPVVREGRRRLLHVLVSRFPKTLDLFLLYALLGDVFCC